MLKRNFFAELDLKYHKICFFSLFEIADHTFNINQYEIVILNETSTSFIVHLGSCPHDLGAISVSCKTVTFPD